MTEDPARYAAYERLIKITALVQGNLDKLISYTVPVTKGGRGSENPNTAQIETLADRLGIIDEDIEAMIARCE